MGSPMHMTTDMAGKRLMSGWLALAVYCAYKKFKIAQCEALADETCSIRRLIIAPMLECRTSQVLSANFVHSKSFQQDKFADGRFRSCQKNVHRTSRPAPQRMLGVPRAGQANMTAP